MYGESVTAKKTPRLLVAAVSCDNVWLEGEILEGKGS